MMLTEEGAAAQATQQRAERTQRRSKAKIVGLLAATALASSAVTFRVAGTSAVASLDTTQSTVTVTAFVDAM